METEGQRIYREYLQTDYWKKASAAAKERAGNRCQICNSSYGLETHHRTYAHRGFELEHLNDLVCLCADCHGRYHEKLPQPIVLAQVGRKKKKKKHKKMKQWVQQNGPVIYVTEKNCRCLNFNKETYHWMKDVGIDPTKSGWRQRCIGSHVPVEWMKGNKAFADSPPPKYGAGMHRAQGGLRAMATPPPRYQ